MARRDFCAQEDRALLGARGPGTRSWLRADDGRAVERHWQAPPARSRARAVILLGLALVSTVTLAALAVRLRMRHAEFHDAADFVQDDVDNSWSGNTDICSKMEQGVEYHTRNPLYELGSIFGPEMCCAECDADPQCSAWTYGERPGVEGLTHHCLLKRLEEGEEPVRVSRPGIVSGLISHRRKHGIVAQVLAKEHGMAPWALQRGVLDNETCPGRLNVTGLGKVSVVSAMWLGKDERAGLVDVPSSGWAVLPRWGSRAYLAKNCSLAQYKPTDYLAVKLVGKKIRYTADLSGAGCGCNALLHLVPMHLSTEPSACHDFVCGHGSSGCGVPCTVVSLQDANQYAWFSGLHSEHHSGVGYGGDGTRQSHWKGRQDWTDHEYGPGAACIDTTWPFQVEVSFPADNEGGLEAMEVTLSQEGQPCILNSRIGQTSLSSKDLLAKISWVLSAGVTPVISYVGHEDMKWLDGLGRDGKGPCAKDAPQACSSSVAFHSFTVEEHNHRREPPQAQRPRTPMLAAIATLHEYEEQRATTARAVGLLKVMPREVGSGFRRECGGDCAALIPNLTNATNIAGGDGLHTGSKHNQGPFSEQHDDNTEWEVLIDRVHVREQPNFAAKVVGDRTKGQIIVGKLTGQPGYGGWIHVTREGGYVATAIENVRLVKERVVSYTKIDQGSCRTSDMFPIKDLRTCQQAAFSLGYFDVDARIYYGDEKRPEGCYLRDGQVWMTTNLANEGNGVVGEIMPICSTKAYPTITSTTTTATSTTTTTTTRPFPSFFCFEVVRTYGYEFPLVKEQLKQHASIFDCEDFSVFSDGGSPKIVGHLQVGQGHKLVKTAVIPKIKKKVGSLKTGDTTNSWLNTLTFLQVWNIVAREGKFRCCDWVIKVDPDAVFFPGRLRLRLKAHTHPGKMLYVMNCNKWGKHALYGSIEVFTTPAVDRYIKGQFHCRKKLHWHGWGEDYFMSHCMDLLKVERFNDFWMLSDKRCYYHPCSDTSRVAYHDYKDASPHGSWFHCWRLSLKR